ncbi:phospholipase A [Simplicispira psychrophila]|uniref:phospholipase A n=1 Tax=Simplicispira psychrophila TaxID=80882 RepID=UPI000A070CA3|nr:phospholipase A [Simplicispira psychrophila]
MTRAALACATAVLWSAFPALVSAQELAPAAASATPAATSTALSDGAWQFCTALGADKEARLACFDQWAHQQAAGLAPQPSGALVTTPPASASAWAQAGQPVRMPMPPPMDNAQAPPVIAIISPEGCRNPQYSDLSRFWELENGTDCGTFSFRGYRPISVSVVKSSSVNRQPDSSIEGHTAATPIDYRRIENRIQLSVRTKIAQGLLTQGSSTRKDSLWFGYSQQSSWQLFSGGISRPFRTTDHEPEVIYVYPTDAELPGGWRLRYSGVGLVHQSNGQSLPLSRSWNRVYLMAGMELDKRWRVQARVWQRITESSGSDDNPDIGSYIGRGELSAFWNADPDNTVGMTVRHTLKSGGRGSAKLEWLQTLGKGFAGGKSNLRLHTQLFSGYGDSLIDYNRQRTVLSVGLSLVDF